MKTTLKLNLLVACAVAAMAISCSTMKSTENLLTTAGFKTIPAATPQQQAHLKTLTPDKVTQIERDGTNYFVFPDPKRQVLYVGQSAQYAEYKKLRAEQKLADEQPNPYVEQEIQTSVWGGW
jgi:hypothetical protein